MTKHQKKELQLHTYYVTGLSGGDYQLSQDPMHEANCGSTGNATCKFTSPDDNLETSIDRNIVDTQQDGITIQSKRNL